MSYILGTYLRSVKENFVKGKGCYLYTDKGEKYLDFVQGIAVNALGHFMAQSNNKLSSI